MIKQTIILAITTIIYFTLLSNWTTETVPNQGFVLTKFIKTTYYYCSNNNFKEIMNIETDARITMRHDGLDMEVSHDTWNTSTSNLNGKAFICHTIRVIDYRDVNLS